MLMDVKPTLEMVVADALALGYEVIVLVVDDEEENQMWCANTGLYIPNLEPNHGYDLNFIARMEREELRIVSDRAWDEAMEKEHGGKISTLEEIEAEESPRYETEIDEEKDIPHDTWFDPENPDAVVDADSACYCGWLGIDVPSKENAPPGCSCFSEGGE